jgi:hypothetical protein
MELTVFTTLLRIFHKQLSIDQSTLVKPSKMKNKHESPACSTEPNKSLIEE